MESDSSRQGEGGVSVACHSAAAQRNAAQGIGRVGARQRLLQLAVAFDASPQPRQAGDRTRTSAFCLWRLLLHETIVGPALPGKQAGEHSRTDKPSLVPSRALGSGH